MRMRLTTILLFAALGGCGGSEAVVVLPQVKPVSITISPASAMIKPGVIVRFTGTVMGSDGRPWTTQKITWSATGNAIGVDVVTGDVHGVAIGTGVVTATFADVPSITAVSTVTVFLEPVGSISITPASSKVPTGGTLQLTPTVKDKSGTLITVPLMWTSSDPSVADVTSNGQVLARSRTGTVTISASADGVSASTSISVVAGDQLVVAKASGVMQVTTLNADGLGKVDLTASALENSWPTWSRDGSRIAYAGRTAQGVATVTLMGKDGSSPQAIASTSMPFIQSPRWSPKRDEIAYVATAGTGMQLHLVDVASGTERRLGSYEWSFVPRWSPDGNTIAFRGQRASNFPEQLMTINRDGSNLTELTLFDKGVTGFCWAPDGSKLYYWAGDVFVIPIAGIAGSGTKLTSFNSPNTGELACAPNGRVTLVTIPPNASRTVIYNMNADGSGLAAVPLTPDTYTFPEWAPDGTRFVVTKGGYAGFGSPTATLLVVDLQGIAREILSAPYIQSAQWNPASP